MEVKEQLKEDEKLLVQVFKLEKFFNKYKKEIIAVTLLIVGYFLANSIYDVYKEHQLTKYNEALNRVIKNPNDREALATLKEDKKLYDLYLLSQNEVPKNPSAPLKEIVAYKSAMKTGTISALEGYLLNPSYKILKDNVRLALVKLYLQNGNRKKAVEIANKITNPQLMPFVKYLLHYGIVK